MRNKLTHNIGLKLASVFFAVMLWMVVNSINDPTVPKYYSNIPVTLLNTNLITDSGQVYEVLDETDTISRVTVRAPRSVLEEIKTENIVATADVSELSSLDTISIKLTTNVSNKDIVSIAGSIDTVKLNIENKRSKALVLKATTSGQVQDGYMVGDVVLDQNLVRISGPQSVIDRVAWAAVDVNVTGMTSDILTNAEIVFYDKDDNVVEDIKNITQNVKSIGVRVSLLQTTQVPVIYDVSGRPASGYRATGEIEGNGEMVTIAGKSSAVRNVSAIEIPPEELDITDRTADYTTTVDIRKYVPQDVSLANEDEALRQVTVYIAPESSKRLEIRGEKVRITNLPEGYNASISELGESFVIEAVGLSKDVAGLQAGDISGAVDIQKWMKSQGMDEPEPGYYTVEVDFGLPESVVLRDPVTVTLHISKIDE